MRLLPVRVVSLAALLLLLGGCGGGRSEFVALLLPATGVNFYLAGPHSVTQIKFAELAEGNPKEFLLFAPETNGAYPLLIFQHGFVSDIDNYTTLLGYIAAHGFIVVAPQMYQPNRPDLAPTIPQEREDARQFIEWVQNNINTLLVQYLTAPLSVQARLDDMGIFGHSRGGQIAWRVPYDPPGFDLVRAVAGVDPVDGDAPPFPPGAENNMHTEEANGNFGFPFPSLIIGMGRGAEGAPGSECAPEERNYQHYYEASAPARFEAVATDFGHSDMLNGDSPNGVCAGATEGFDALRRFVAGQVVAYFTLVLKQFDETVFLTRMDEAPVATTNRFQLR